MSVAYKRLGVQGEVHQSNDGKMTLCGIKTTHPNWIDNVELTDKDPLLCLDCLNAKPKDDKKEAKPKAKKEEPSSEK